MSRQKGPVVHQFFTLRYTLELPSLVSSSLRTDGWSSTKVPSMRPTNCTEIYSNLFYSPTSVSTTLSLADEYSTDLAKILRVSIARFPTTLDAACSTLYPPGQPSFRSAMLVGCRSSYRLSYLGTAIGEVCFLRLSQPTATDILPSGQDLWANFPRYASLGYVLCFQNAMPSHSATDSVTRSPLYSIYGETIAGVTIIRAFGASSKFLRDMLRCVDTVRILSAFSFLFLTVFRTRILTIGCGAVSMLAIYFELRD